MVCTGYITAWFTNLHQFRQRSIVERIFWSVPLSLSVSTIASVLIGRFLSLAAVVEFLLVSAAVWVATLIREWTQLRRSGKKWAIGFNPLGGKALSFALIWILVTVLLLADLQSGHRLFMSLAFFDHGMRINWTESVLRTGVPPVNSLYLYKQPAPMRYYYFWYVVCAAVVKMAHLPTRAVLTASCAWSGFVLAALIGLYLKHFLSTGARLRRQFTLSIFLLTVTGLGICVNLWDILYLHDSLPGYLEVWKAGQISSWFDSLIWDPHHVASMACCMFAFLLAWMAGKRGHLATNIVLIAMALASAFGLSIYVAFAFFLVMLTWALWQLAIERTSRPALVLGSGGIGAAVLLVPYLKDLTHASSNLQEGSVFAFAVRETIPPDRLLASPLFQHLASSYPAVSQNLANLTLLAPGYVVELGFFLFVLILYLVPAWRGRIALTAAQRSLIFIATATLLLMSFVRSGVLVTNDFGWRTALLLQFPLLLLASELVMSWRLADKKLGLPADFAGLPKKRRAGCDR